MLQAVIRHQRTRHEEHENEIVSAIFGPLFYFPAKMRMAFFEEFLREFFGETVAPRGAASDAGLLFWPTLKPAPDRTGRSVTPDLIVELRNGERLQRVIIFEFKWNSGLMDRQLSNQRTSAAANPDYDCKSNAVLLRHVLITKKRQTDDELAHGLDTMESPTRADESRYVLRNVTWPRLVKFLTIIKTSDSGWPAEFKLWCSQSAEFLMCLGQIPFSGFGNNIFPLFNSTDPRERRCWRFQPRLMHVEEILKDHHPDEWKRVCWQYSAHPEQSPDSCLQSAGD